MFLFRAQLHSKEKELINFIHGLFHVLICTRGSNYCCWCGHTIPCYSWWRNTFQHTSSPQGKIQHLKHYVRLILWFRRTRGSLCGLHARSWISSWMVNTFKCICILYWASDRVSANCLEIHNWHWQAKYRSHNENDIYLQKTEIIPSASNSYSTLLYCISNTTEEKSWVVNPIPFYLFCNPSKQSEP